jgi:hypothetical protein
MRPLPAPENRCEPIRGLKGGGGVGQEDAPIPTTFVTFMHDRAAAEQFKSQVGPYVGALPGPSSTGAQGPLLGIDGSLGLP